VVIHYFAGVSFIIVVVFVSQPHAKEFDDSDAVTATEAKQRK